MFSKHAWLGLVLAAGCLASCARSERAAAEAGSAAKASAVDVVEGNKADPAIPSLGRAFFSTNLGGDRLLAYELDLSYRGTNLAVARRKMLGLVETYGYLENENATAGDEATLQVTFRVRTTRLLACLAELDQVGTLERESIHAEDLTPGERERRLKATREAKRVERRNLRLNRLDAQSQAGPTAEEALSRSEDRQDQAWLEGQQIQDRVEWARVRVQVDFPPAPATLHQPPWKNLGIQLLSAVLWIGYVLAWVILILLVGCLGIAVLVGLFWFLLFRNLIRWIRRNKTTPG